MRPTNQPKAENEDAIRESLAVWLTSEERTEVFQREGEAIHVKDRSEPIRVGHLTPSIAALLALLPAGDERRSDIQTIANFLRGVSYYDLSEMTVGEDLVPEHEYREWLSEFSNEGTTTQSVAFRLIYMFHENKDMFAELKALLGRDGLGLIDDIHIASWGQSRNAIPSGATGSIATETVHFLTFSPSKRLGGAGRQFTYSKLSFGTRRVLRILTSLLFDKRSVMLLEQPEESIHPGLLRRLIDVLRSYSVEAQMIFTTHSPEVLDIVRPEEVILVWANGGETEARGLSRSEVDGGTEIPPE